MRPSALLEPMSLAQLRFLLSSSAENLIRLEALLERRRELGSAPEFNAIIAAMLHQCRRYREQYLRHATVIRKVLSAQPISRVEEIGLKTLLRNCINTFLVLHELLLFLPRETVRRELHFFCQTVFSPKYDPADLSIILTSVYNAFEYSLDAAVRSLDVMMMKVPDPNNLGFGHVMELAIIDRDNPLSWPILAHEFGHYLDEKANISEPLTEHFIDNDIKAPASQRAGLLRVFKPLASELFADLTSYFLLGPVSILPIVNMELNFGMATDYPTPYDGIHPFTSTRLQVISDAASADHMNLDLFKSYVDALREDEVAKLKRLPGEKKKERTTIRQYTTFFAKRLRSAFLSAIEEFGLTRYEAESLKVSETLNEQLKRGVPVGSRRSVAEDTLRESMNTLTDSSSVKDSRAVFALFKEQPVSVAEVLTAGWMFSSEHKAVWLKDAFDRDNLKDIFPSFRATLGNQDKLLIKSIEVTSVMQGAVDASV